MNNVLMREKYSHSNNASNSGIDVQDLSGLIIALLIIFVIVIRFLDKEKEHQENKEKGNKEKHQENNAEKYSMEIHWSNEDKAFIVTVPELPGCKTHGNTYEEAVRQGKDAIESWIEASQAWGDPIPPPGILNAV